ncbi:MAG: 2-oxoacid:acceptor oxidoreductase family protein [Rhodopseudomonas sp.]|uniref:2-oxoacid:acceptor oxidoreductase family protein n=1 Tax=Rhodopseudomonas sp. TaxID=1078 RepID=UPI00185974E2|nr:2-oxoacid:acceptor oxidoreductase family protein [Rhodopseudomonas sp.]NVN88158.1 2-oxoacid:acceptor oxidoreductase family protein [Rhodopseudomonas sp.]
MNAKYPGLPTVIHGNGAVAQVMGHVCGGVIGYPITPSTEISEIYEAFRSSGGCNVWGKHPFFFEPEGEHSAQSGALGAALTGGKFISNASSSQGILYGLESHYVTVGKKVGGFVLQVAARVVSKHSLNVMAGHDDVYALLSSGYTILFGANPQEAADLAAISYKVSATSLIPVANAMDGFATSHMLSEALMPEPELLREFLGDPSGRIKCPTVAQEMLFGAKGRVFQLKQYLARHEGDFVPADLEKLKAHLSAHANSIEADNAGALIGDTLALVPEELRGQWKRQWINAPEKGTRQLVPALVDIDNPGLTGGVQNQPDFQAGAVDHRTHFANAVPRFVKEAMAEYSALTGREYKPVMTYMCDDAETVLVGLGSVTDDAEAVATYLRSQGKKVGVVAIKLLQPFPEAELVAALAGKKAVTVLERSDVTALTGFVTHALCKARENADGVRHAGIPPIDRLPKITTAIFGLGAHDLQPRHLIAAYQNMENPKTNAPFVYLGTQFFSKNPSPRMEALQDRLKAAYPETEFMALECGENPSLLPASAFRIRFHSIGGYGTIASGKLLTDILAGVLDLHSKSAPKYGSEKSGAPTNYYITLSPEPVKITNAELEDVEIVISPDHKVFIHTNPLRGLVAGGTFILQSNLSPLEVWRELPANVRKTIRDRKIRFFVIDAFAVAKRHAPTAELETRMMGIAFIGAVCGHVDRVVADASEDVILTKIRQQIAKKFGAKGGPVVEGNMAVIREGLEATHKVDYDAPEFRDAEVKTAAKKSHDVSTSAAMCRIAGPASAAGFLDPQYYDDVMAAPFRDGTIADAPVMPGIGMFMPAGSAAMKDKGLFRRNVPEFKPELCTGCLECALVCPDAAIPNAVHDIHELLGTAIKQLDIAPAQQEALRGQIPALSEAIREVYRGSKDDKPFHDIVAQASAALDVDNATLKRNFGKLAAALQAYPVARTRPFFDAMEKSQPGSGGLYSVSVDPWKCSGCLECIDVCGPGALVDREQDEPLLETLQTRFEFLSRMPNTPARFFDGATREGGETKRLMLDRANYYATTGGHGACRGCGEVTAIRLVTSTNHAIHDKRRKDHTRELEALIEQLTAKRDAVAADAERCARIDRTLKTLEKRLYLYESGPTGNGPSGMVIANATGCSSVYASTFPFNPYTDPWVNSLFQDTPAVAKGIFEGLTAAAADDFRGLRIAKLELADAYDPTAHDNFFRYFGWGQFTPEERGLLPTVLSMGGDGATYDIGFGALSRLLATKTPIKVVVLNTGAYSNTGGQTSTASLTGQDSDLSRYGVANSGKQESRKELGLIASFHPNVFVVQTSTALQGHFLKNVMEFLNYTNSPAVLDVYTPCQAEHGIGDAVANRQARKAVESRMNPVFVHDPRRGANLHSWFSLDGNPEPDQDWASQSIEYVDDNGATQLLKVKVTPADFAFTEVRFKKQFKPLAKDADAVPVDEYVALGTDQRAGKTPFIYGTDDDKRLVRYAVGATVIQLVEERRKYWRTLQYLGGFDVRALDEAHHAELAALRQQYDESVKARESSLDSIARGMSELAASSNAPAAGGFAGLMAGLAPTATAPAAAINGAKAANGNGAIPIHIDECDLEKCTNCKSCYQDVPEVFELTKIVVGGVSKDVAHVIPGVFSKIKITPELSAKLSRAAANCDAEIIR